MASGIDKKRQRQDSDTKQDSPTQNQSLKKYKHIEDIQSDSSYIEFEDKEEEIEGLENVSTFKMAGTSDPDSMTAAVIKALQNPHVIETLINPIREEIKKGFQEEIKELKDIINEKNTKIKDLETRVSDLEKNENEKVCELENKVEQLEMYGRRNGVRIYGIDEEKGENTDQLVLNLAHSIGADIPKFALGRSHRVGRPNNKGHRAIIAKFISHNYKVELLKCKKNLRKNSSEDENEDDEVQNVRAQIFINEDLTKLRMDWAKRARKLKADGKATDTWTRDGTIFIKVSDKQVERVDNEHKLRELEQNLPVLPPKQPSESADVQ